MPGEDDIMPEVLRKINIDDIILDFSDEVLLENKTPKPLKFSHTKIRRPQYNIKLSWNSSNGPFKKYVTVKITIFDRIGPNLSLY